MEYTITASQAATNALDDIRTGRVGIIIARMRQETKSETKIPFAKLTFSFIMVAIFAWWIMTPKIHHLSGMVSDGKRAFAECHVIFRSHEGKNHDCFTKEDGSFNVSLPPGQYKIYRIERNKKILSPTSLKLNENQEIAVFFKH